MPPAVVPAIKEWIGFSFFDIVLMMRDGGVWECLLVSGQKLWIEIGLHFRICTLLNRPRTRQPTKLGNDFYLTPRRSGHRSPVGIAEQVAECAKLLLTAVFTTLPNTLSTLFHLLLQHRSDDEGDEDCCVFTAKIPSHMTHVLLLRSPQESADKYELAFRSSGFIPYSIPVLETVLVNHSMLKDIVRAGPQVKGYDGVIVTSARACEAWGSAVQSLDRDGIYTDDGKLSTVLMKCRVVQALWEYRVDQDAILCCWSCYRKDVSRHCLSCQTLPPRHSWGIWIWDWRATCSFHPSRSQSIILCPSWR